MPVIRNHTQWRDTTGQPIDCHEGGILRVGDDFYWYGRSYRGNVDGVYGTPGAGFRCPLVCYRSRDLVSWSFEAVCLAYPEEGWLTTGTWHRPRVLFCPQTGRYVLWFFCLGTPEGKPWVRDVVAVAERPSGPFRVIGQPTVAGIEPSGDLALWQDESGRAYLANGDWQRNGWVLELTGDYCATTGKPALALRASAASRAAYEGLCLARYQGKMIVAGSGVAGLDSTDTSYAVADVPLGPYREKGLMSRERTWNSQISSFFYLAESDCLMALCEQWLTGPAGERVPGERSSQLWLPVKFDAAAERVEMDYREQWDPWTPG